MSAVRSVIVTGGRKRTDVLIVEAKLELFCAAWGIEQVVQGGARGVDKIAREWARRRGLLVCTYGPLPPFGPPELLARNLRMLADFPDAPVLGFPGRGKSHGTYHCLRHAAARARTIAVFPEGKA